MSRAATLIEGLKAIPGAIRESEFDNEANTKTGYKCSSKYIVKSSTGEVFGIDLNFMNFKDAWNETKKFKDHDDLVVLYKDEGGVWNKTNDEGPTGEVVSFKVVESFEFTESFDKNGTPVFAGLTVGSPNGDGKVSQRIGDVAVVHIGEHSFEFTCNELEVKDIPSLDADGEVEKNTPGFGLPGPELSND